LLPDVQPSNSQEEEGKIVLLGWTIVCVLASYSSL
jgi:hypothetical protein